MKSLFKLLIICIFLNNYILIHSQQNNTTEFMGYKSVLNGYYKSVQENPDSGEPVFEGKVEKEDINNHKYYFVKFSIYSLKNNQIRAIRYQYVINQKIQGEYYYVKVFEKNNEGKLINKYILKKSISYNNKGLYKKIVIFKKEINNSQYINEFYFYNDYGVFVRKVIYTYNKESNVLIKKEISTDFVQEENILGDKTY